MIDEAENGEDEKKHWTEKWKSDSFQLQSVSDSGYERSTPRLFRFI